jgi:multidrug efflux system membrane fusion protein
MGFLARSLKVLLPLVVVGVATLAAVVLVRSKPEVATQVPLVAPPGVRAHLVQVDTVQVPVLSQGTVRPRTETQIVPQIAGRVTWVAPSFAPGGFFEEGDVLLRIDPFDYQQAMISARSQLAQARLRLAQEEAESEIALREWQSLGRGDPRALTLREPQLEDARASVAAAEAGLVRAERDLERADVKAPYVGRVRSKNVDVGQFVTVGAAIATVYAVDVAEIRLPLPDEQLAYLDLPLTYRGAAIQDGPRVTFRTTFAGAPYEWRGRIVRTEGEIDPVSRMVHVVAEVRDPYASGSDPRRPPLAVGMYVEAEIEGRAFDEIVVVPRAALQGRNQVLTIDRDSRLQFREIDILRATSESVYVRSGLTQGETVAISSLDGPTDGMLVQVTDISGDAVADRQTDETMRRTAPRAESSVRPDRSEPMTDAARVSPARGGRPEWLVRVYRESAQATRAPRRAANRIGRTRTEPPVTQRAAEAPANPIAPPVTQRAAEAPANPIAPPVTQRAAEAPANPIAPPVTQRVAEAEAPASPIAPPPALLSPESPAPPPSTDDEVDDVPEVATASPVTNRALAVAVLPFVNLTQGAATGALGTGLTQDVSIRLRDLESVVVVPSDTNAGWLVGGGVQQLGDTVRVTARVVDTRGGEIVWAVKVDGAANDLSRLRVEVAAAIEAGIVEALGIVAAPAPATTQTPDGIVVRTFSNLSLATVDADVGQTIVNAVTDHLLALGTVSVVADESRAAWIISGGIPRVGNIVRITASLVDVAKGSVVRAVKVDGLISRLAQLQSQVASELGHCVREMTS